MSWGDDVEADAFVRRNGEFLAVALAPSGQIVMRRAQPPESREVRQWVIERHYLRSAPPGYRFALEFLRYPNGRTSERIGAMLLGRPTSRSLDHKRVLELTRMYFVDDTPPNMESWALARMRKWVRVWMPEVRLLLAYSDPSVGHQGTVYEADGWAPFGQTATRTVGWKNRPNRRGEETPSRKLRWVRTP